MILSLLQIKMRLFPDFIFFFLIPLLIIIDIFILKIALKITHAPERTSFKWVILSLFTQIGVLIFIASPLILMGISGAFQDHGPDPGLVLTFVILALFINLNVLNVFHRLGFKKALIVFAMVITPFIIGGGIVDSLIRQAEQISQSQNQPPPPPQALFFIFLHFLLAII